MSQCLKKTNCGSCTISIPNKETCVENLDQIHIIVYTQNVTMIISILCSMTPFN